MLLLWSQFYLNKELFWIELSQNYELLVRRNDNFFVGLIRWSSQSDVVLHVVVQKISENLLEKSGGGVYSSKKNLF